MPGAALIAHSRCIPHAQSGAAAIELAVSMLLLLMIFFAIISYGALFWVQQTLSQLAGEGARYALTSSYQGVPPDQVATGACTHLQALATQDLLINSMGEASFQCTSNPSSSTDLCPTDVNCTALKLSIDINGWPLLNIMRTLTRVFTDDPPLPARLFANSLVQIAPGSTSP